jgi:hypothetical protein
VKGRPQTYQIPPSTPSKRHDPFTITTPLNRRDLKAQFEQIAAEEEVSRSIRTLVRKTVKTLDTLTFEGVRQTQQITSLTSQVEHLSNKRRKKVPIDMNDQFARIEDIIKVQATIEQNKVAWERQDRAKIARESSSAMLHRNVEGCLHVFHVCGGDEPTATATL